MTEFAAGLSLKAVEYVQIGEEKFSQRQSKSGLMVAPVQQKVPLGTKAVLPSIRTVDFAFGTPAGVQALALSRVYFEFTEEDDSQLGVGVYKCKVRALLRSDSDVVWTPYIVLQLMCFG